MAINKKALADKIRRRFGAPAIKVELEDSQIYDAIDYTKQKFLKWATGQATVETFFTLMLSAGTNFYDLPVGVTEVISYNGNVGVTSGINTLFTIENYLYSQGYFEALYNTGGAGYTIISYHIARDFLDTVRRYTPDKYNWKYHPYTNEIEIHPAPASGNSLVLSDGTYDSPGFVLLRTYMIEGSQYDGYTAGDENNNFYALDWIFDYAFADCKERLGYIYRKFDQFQSIGNVGLNLNGNELVQEAKEEKERLEEKLKLEETWDGYDISIGW